MTAAVLMAAVVLLITTGAPRWSEAQSLPVISFTNINSSVDEPQNGTYETVNVEVELSQISNQDLSVQYRAVDSSSADVGKDYHAPSGTLTTPAGSTSGSFQVRIIDDNHVEHSQRFRLELHPPVGATLGADANTFINIIDLDESDSYYLIVPTEFREDGGSFEVIVDADRQTRPHRRERRGRRNRRCENQTRERQPRRPSRYLHVRHPQSTGTLSGPQHQRAGHLPRPHGPHTAGNSGRTVHTELGRIDPPAGGRNASETGAKPTGMPVL